MKKYWLQPVSKLKFVTLSAINLPLRQPLLNPKGEEWTVIPKHADYWIWRRKRGGGEDLGKGGEQKVERKERERCGEKREPNASLFNTECLLPIHIYFTFLFDSAGCNSSRLSAWEVEVAVCARVFRRFFFLFIRWIETMERVARRRIFRARKGE